MGAVELPAESSAVISVMRWFQTILELILDGAVGATPNVAMADRAHG